ncbi:nucleotidyltransferase family protein [Emcibacter nanhaiensis]|uniref:nucleotidyltransferase family protein n=1 Tax=Emcibacter nanhaiensis TaxID=1505037 RepID=UPI0015E3EECD|nr:nucleotidyltransferase family protein [Emcibacter nanhaiensis]
MTTASPDIEIVVLAAGLSRRMGEANKLLLEIDGEPLVRRAVRRYRACAERVIVVLGHEADRVREALSGLDVRCVVNPDYQEGRQSTARAGFQAAAMDGEAVMLALADQPLLEEADIALLIDGFMHSGRDKIFIPYFQGARGNPVIFPASLARDIKADRQVPGCRKFIDAHPELVHRFEVPNNHFMTDIDTPEEAQLFGAMPQ